MITYQKALEIAKYKLIEMQNDDLVLTLLLEYTITEDFGWVFFYNSIKFVETQDMSFALFGNSPFIVDKESGEVIRTGTARPIEFYIEKYKLGEKW